MPHSKRKSGHRPLCIIMHMVPMTGFSVYKDRFLGRNAAMLRDASLRYPLN